MAFAGYFWGSPNHQFWHLMVPRFHPRVSLTGRASFGISEAWWKDDLCCMKVRRHVVEGTCSVNDVVSCLNPIFMHNHGPWVMTCDFFDLLVYKNDGLCEDVGRSLLFSLLFHRNMGQELSTRSSGPRPEESDIRRFEGFKNPANQQLFIRLLAFKNIQHKQQIFIQPFNCLSSNFLP